MRHCPHCGQRLLIRHGVRLPPLLADFFDHIEGARYGIMLEVLAGVFYPGMPQQHAMNNVRVNICRLNDYFASTDIHIGSDGQLTPYRVRKTNGG